MTTMETSFQFHRLTRIEHEPDYFKSIQEDPKRTETL